LKKRRKKRSSYNQVAKLILFICIILILFIVHLIGKVNMDMVLIKNDELTERRKSLKKRINELKVVINRKRGYKRIVNLARKQGLIFIPPAQISELTVNLDNSNKYVTQTKEILSKLAQCD